MSKQNRDAGLLVTLIFVTLLVTFIGFWDSLKLCFALAVLVFGGVRLWRSWNEKRARGR
jgi:hypothetical protein